MTPQDIAERLVADGFARRAPNNGRCVRTIELQATPDGWGNLYVKPSGAVLRGHTLRSATPVARRFYDQITGDTA